MPSHRVLARNVEHWLLWSALGGPIALCIYGAVANHIFAQVIWEPVGWRRFERFAAIFFGFAFTTIALRPQLLPRIVIVLAATYTVLGVGAAPFITVCAFLFSSYVLGSAFVLGTREGTAADDLIAVVTGVGVYIFALFFLVRLPVNYPALYAGLLVLPLIAAPRSAVLCAKRCLRTLSNASIVNRSDAAACSLSAFLLVAHLLVTLKPDVSADGLAMHLAIPADVAYHHRYTFDPAQTLWAVMPMGADWAYSFVYALGGEYAAKLLNYAMLLIVAGLLFDAVRARSGPVWAWLMTALFASTPLVQLVTGSLFIENTLAAFCLAGLAALCRFRATGRKDFLLVAAFLLGSALSIKAGAVTFVAAVAVVASIMLFPRPFAMPRRPWMSAATIALFAAPACTPYVNAWLRTGNPLYPFLNREFASPVLGRDESFEDQRFCEPFLWRTPYDLTFHTSRFSDTQDGAAGFVFVVQIPLAILILLIARSRDWVALSALAVFLLDSVLVLKWAPNLRYIYPVFPLACVALGGALATARRWHPAFRYTLGAAIVSLAVIQCYMMPSSGWYDKDFYISRLLSQGDTVYIREHAPIRVLVAWLNSNAPNQPVLFVRDDQIAGLHGPAYSTVWHHDPLRRQLLQCRTADAVAKLFERLGIRWFVVPEDMGDFSTLKEFMLKYTVRRFTMADHYVAQLRML